MESEDYSRDTEDQLAKHIISAKYFSSVYIHRWTIFSSKYKRAVEDLQGSSSFPSTFLNFHPYVIVRF